MGPRALARLLAPVPAFFGFRIASALLLLKLSASYLSVGGFAIFSQFLLFASLLNLVAVGGTQNGLIRQSAAAGDAEALGRTRTAGFVIWIAVAPPLFLIALIASGAISTLLTGASSYWWVVILITAVALSAGPAQIWCSILSGRKRVAASLSAQAAGLTLGTAGAAWRIGQGDPAGAAIAFACGSLVTLAVASRLMARLDLAPAALRPAAPDAKLLLRYSAALAATIGFTAISLFALRSLYRSEFGATALGYWLAANRISDMSSQLLGLFMIQFFVPHVAAMTSEIERRALIVRCWAAASAAAALAIAIFSIAPEPLVRLFLSEAFVPAIPVIRTYMIGDLLRVTASLAMFSAFARGQPWRYAMIEIATVSTMAAIAITLIGLGDPRAPQIAYVAAYALAALAVAIGFARKPAMRQAAV